MTVTLLAGIAGSTLTFAGSLSIAFAIGPMGDGIAGASDSDGNLRPVVMLKHPRLFRFGLVAIIIGFAIDLVLKCS